MVSFHEMNERALQVRRMYAQTETERYGREWSPEELALGFVGDVGDLVKLVQGKAGVRPRPDLDEALAHELADCLWSVMVLAHTYEVDLESAFAQAMNDLDQFLSS